MWTDTELQHHVEAELGWELKDGLTQVSVLVKGGTVELAGHVDSLWERYAAERAAWRVVHVTQVANNIHVVIPFEQQREDDDIALAAMNILEWNALVPSTVEVQVSKAMLTLTGTVERQQQRQEAERAMSALRGIAGIHNNIAIEPAVALAEAKTSVEAALRRNALVDSNRIKVHLAHGVASVRGSARVRAEYEEAMELVWLIPGIVKVEDHLTTGTA